MAETSKELIRQLEKLKAEAEAVRKREVAGVISRIKEAIEAYGITASDLGFGGSAESRSKAKKQAAGEPGRRDSGSATQAKYRDSEGRTWRGRGPRPRWLRDAIAAGQALESFAVSTGAGQPAALSSHDR